MLLDTQFIETVPGCVEVEVVSKTQRPKKAPFTFTLLLSPLLFSEEEKCYQFL